MLPTAVGGSLPFSIMHLEMTAVELSRSHYLHLCHRPFSFSSPPPCSSVSPPDRPCPWATCLNVIGVDAGVRCVVVAVLVCLYGAAGTVIERSDNISNS